MRCMVRNKTELFYASYTGKTEIVDEYGNVTGEFELNYGKPQRCFVNVSAARGEIQTRQFGEGETYDKVIVLENPNMPIDEYSILWIDTKPTLNSDGTTETPHDYIVKKVARSLNNVSIAVSKVTVQ